MDSSSTFALFFADHAAVGGSSPCSSTTHTIEDSSYSSCSDKSPFQTHNAILRLLNGISSDNLHSSLSALAQLITVCHFLDFLDISLIHCQPKSNVYRTDNFIDGILQMRHTNAIFVWKDISQVFSDHCPFPNAAYAVSMFIPSIEPFHSLNFAWALLTFVNSHSSQSHTRFCVVSLAFVLGPQGTYALILFDRKFRAAYVNAHCSLNGTPVHRYQGCPITFLPSAHAVHLLSRKVLDDLDENTWYVSHQSTLFFD